MGAYPLQLHLLSELLSESAKNSSSLQSLPSSQTTLIICYSIPFLVPVNSQLWLSQKKKKCHRVGDWEKTHKLISGT